MLSEIKSSRLKDRIALITGAGSGIGRAMAIKFAKESANIIIADIDIDLVAIEKLLKYCSY